MSLEETMEKKEPVGTLVIIRGIAGTGKTTLANKLIDAEPGRWHHYEADMYFVDKDGKYHFAIDNLGNAHVWCKGEVERCLRNNQDVIVSNTFTRLWELENYLKLAEVYNYEVVTHDLTEEHGSIHDVPVEVLHRQRVTFEPIDHIKKVYEGNVTWSEFTVDDLMKQGELAL